MADDLATSSVLDPTIGFVTHKTHTKLMSPLTNKELKTLSLQKALYAKALSANSRFAFKKCDRYKADNGVGAKIVATNRIYKHEIIHDLCGRLCLVNESFFTPELNEFFIVNSTYRNRTRLWLGPATYTNHDCESNGEIFYVNGHVACVKAIKMIQPGDEITVNYGRSFFSAGGCACVTCEKNGTGAFST